MKKEERCVAGVLPNVRPGIHNLGCLVTSCLASGSWSQLGFKEAYTLGGGDLRDGERGFFVFDSSRRKSSYGTKLVSCFVVCLLFCSSDGLFALCFAVCFAVYFGGGLKQRTCTKVFSGGWSSFLLAGTFHYICFVCKSWLFRY